MTDDARPQPEVREADAKSLESEPADGDVHLRLAAWLAAVSAETGSMRSQAPDPAPDERDPSEWVH